MGFKVSQIGTAGSMAVLVLVLESMAANAGFEINSLTCCVLTSFRKVYWKTTILASCSSDYSFNLQDQMTSPYRRRTLRDGLSRGDKK